MRAVAAQAREHVNKVNALHALQMACRRHMMRRGESPRMRRARSSSASRLHQRVDDTNRTLLGRAFLRSLAEAVNLGAHWRFSLLCMRRPAFSHLLFLLFAMR